MDQPNDSSNGHGAPKTTVNGHAEEDEAPVCRVCRMASEPGEEALCRPCKCKGTIKYAHQDW